MKLSVSNIGWDGADDEQVYHLMRSMGFNGLEIAPTRIFPENPYDDLSRASEWAMRLMDAYGFVVSSMQSIWYGRTEKLFGSYDERNELIMYTKKAIDFAEAIGCANLVFGCPRNRSIPNNADAGTAIAFFKEISDYALEHQTVIAIEANPPIYNTNYINDTKSAIDLVEEINSDGFKLNLDIGTMVENKEDVSILEGKEKYINHIHISEPRLKTIEKRMIHWQLAELLRQCKYDKYVSIEVGKQGNISDLKKMMEYVRDIMT